jgi:hypothetical protein
MEPLSEDNFSEFAREPLPHHWQMLNKLDETSITLDEFLRHWRLNKTQLARLVGCDRKTVRRWLAHLSEPTGEQKWRLGIIHRLWSRT